MLEEFALSSGIVPKALEAKPELSPYLTWYFDEFNMLSHDRNLDQGYPTPLTTGQIREYCDFFNIEDRLTFYAMVRTIDRLYLDRWYAKKKAEKDRK